MPDLLLRNVPQHVVDALERQAVLHGHSAEAEHRTILEAALRTGFWERAAALREETRGRISGDSTDLIRQDRDER
jgi:plasmid stability protein